MSPPSPDLNATLNLGVNLGVEGMSTSVHATILVRHAAGGWTGQASIPAGSRPTLQPVKVPAGVYSVEATLPSGLSLCLDGEISPGEQQSVLLAGPEVMPQPLDWSSFALSGAVSILQKARENLDEKVLPKIEEALTRRVSPMVTATLSREGARVYERYQLPIRQRFAKIKDSMTAWASSGALETLFTAPKMDLGESVTPTVETTGTTQLESLYSAPVSAPQHTSEISICYWVRRRTGHWSKLGPSRTIPLTSDQAVLQVPAPDLEALRNSPHGPHRLALVEVFGLGSGISEFCMMPLQWKNQMDQELGVSLLVDTLSESRKESAMLVRLRTTVQDPDLALLMGAMKNSDHQVVDRVLASVAEEYLLEKFRNPLMAAAAALALLKMRQVESLHDWTHNLASQFPELPDGPVIRAWHLLFGGVARTGVRDDTPRYWLLESVRRGPPLFFESLRLLVDGLQLLQHPDDAEEAAPAAEDKEVTRALSHCQAYLWAADADEDFTSYRGSHPDAPGLPQRRSRKKKSDHPFHIPPHTENP